METVKAGPHQSQRPCKSGSELELHLRGISNGIKVSTHGLVHGWWTTPQNLRIKESKSASIHVYVIWNLLFITDISSKIYNMLEIFQGGTQRGKSKIKSDQI
jgi:hypothetical protein